MDGIIVINKSSGLSSSRVGHKVKKMLDLKKVGHLGTLDPMATGVLPLCVNEGTKLAQFLSEADKEYVATLKLGAETDTQDSEGKVLSSTDDIPTDCDVIRRVIQGFKGEILQLPPMYSALKHKGVPLYKLARKGESVPRPERKVIIYDIEVLEVDIPYVTFRLVCSGGTYVRTICHDAGQKLFCGAHMTSLKRIRSGPFHINQALEVEDIEGFSCKRAVEEYLVSPKDALIRLAEVIVSEELVDKVKNGVQITAEDIFEMELPDFKVGQKIKIISPEGFLVGVVESLKDKEALFSEGNPEDKVFKSLRVFSVGN
jgi:tRNA pseudouridine55 synthase